jgi:hypothetical protein
MASRISFSRTSAFFREAVMLLRLLACPGRSTLGGSAQDRGALVRGPLRRYQGSPPAPSIGCTGQGRSVRDVGR